MRVTFLERKVTKRTSPKKAQLRVKLGFFCKQKNALTDVSMLEQFRTQDI